MVKRRAKAQPRPKARAPRASAPAPRAAKRAPGAKPARGAKAQGAKARAPKVSAGREWTARDLMREDVITVDQSTPLSEVERLFVEHRISGAPVTDETGVIVGVVSIRDLVERYAEDPDARPRRGRGWFHLDTEELAEEDVESSEVPAEAEETARDVMTVGVYSVAATATLREIAQAMSEHKIHRVLVEAEGRHVGLLTTMDLLAAIAGRRPPQRRNR